MLIIILSGAVLAVVGGAGVAIGLRLMAHAKAAIEAALPERMVDYCGFVPEAVRD